MTLKEALELCKILWLWFAKHPEFDVTNPCVAKGRALAILSLPYLRNGCPCCEYAWQKVGTHPYCTECPFVHIWGANYGCERLSSPYLLWKKAKSPTERTKQAMRLVAMCDKELTLLKEDHVNGG